MHGYPKNHGKFWTHTDIAALTKLANRGHTKKELAEFFGEQNILYTVKLSL